MATACLQLRCGGDAAELVGEVEDEDNLVAFDFGLRIFSFQHRKPLAVRVKVETVARTTVCKFRHPDLVKEILVTEEIRMSQDAVPQNVNCEMVCCAMSIVLDPMTQWVNGSSEQWTSHNRPSHS